MRALLCVLRINAWRVMCNFILHACIVKLHAFWCSVPRVFTPRVHEVVFELYCSLCPRVLFLQAQSQMYVHYIWLVKSHYTLYQNTLNIL